MRCDFTRDNTRDETRNVSSVINTRTRVEARNGTQLFDQSQLFQVATVITATLKLVLRRDRFLNDNEDGKGQEDRI